MVDLVQGIMKAGMDVVSGGAEAPPPQDMELTLRELEVLRGIAECRRNSEIAQDLFISTRTVEKHVENILRKLGVKRRMQAAQRLRVFPADSGKTSKTVAA